MKALLNFYVDLCLLRSEPQQLPASKVLFVLVLIANVVIGLLLAFEARYSVSAAWSASLLDSAMLLAFLYGALLVKSLPERFLQAGTALMGSMALLSLLVIPVLSLSATAGEESGASGSALLLLFIPIIWMWTVIVIGHILRHVLNTSLVTGIALAGVYTVVSTMTLSSLFPVG